MVDVMRIPLACKNFVHNKGRMIASVGGVAFAFAAWWIVQKVSARIGIPLARIEPAPEPFASPAGEARQAA